LPAGMCAGWSGWSGGRWRALRASRLGSPELPVEELTEASCLEPIEVSEVAFPVVVTLASSRMAETQVATEEEKEKLISFLEKLISSEGKIGARAA